MHGMDDRLSGDDNTQMFRRPVGKWLICGSIGVVGGAAFNGSPLHTWLSEAAGPHYANALTLVLGASGALALLMGGFLLTEHTSVTEAAIEQYNLGRPCLRILWQSVTRVTLYRGRKERQGPIELLNTDSRTMRIDRGIGRFDELEALILERVAPYSPDIRDHR